MKPKEGNIKITETELLTKMQEWIINSDVDELCVIATKMFGGEIYWLPETDEENPSGENHYEVYPSESYGGAFGEFPTKN